jgi:hypothetical protein
MSLWYSIPLAAAGLAFLLLLRWLIHPAPRLVIGERGFLQRGLGWGWIPWSEVEGAYPPSVDEGDSVRVRLRVTRRLAEVLRARRRLAEDAPLEQSVEVRLDLAGTDLNAVELLREIQVRAARGGEDPEPVEGPSRAPGGASRGPV